MTLENMPQRPVITEGQARPLHERGLAYALFKGPIEQPTACIFMQQPSGGIRAVHYRDGRVARVNTWGSHGIHGIKGGDYFLFSAFDVVRGEQIRSCQMTFKTSGLVEVSRHLDGTVIPGSEVDVNIDVSSLWAPPPAFGDYEHFFNWDAAPVDLLCQE